MYTIVRRIHDANIDPTEMATTGTSFPVCSELLVKWTTSYSRTSSRSSSCKDRCTGFWEDRTPSWSTLRRMVSRPRSPNQARNTPSPGAAASRQEGSALEEMETVRNTENARHMDVAGSPSQANQTEMAACRLGFPPPAQFTSPAQSTPWGPQTGAGMTDHSRRPNCWATRTGISNTVPVATRANLTGHPSLRRFSHPIWGDSASRKVCSGLWRSRRYGGRRSSLTLSWTLCRSRSSATTWSS